MADITVFNILSQDNITQVTQSIIDQAGSMVKPLMIGTKVLAIGFLIVNWMQQLLEYMDEKNNGKSPLFPFTPSKIIYSILYITLIVNINVFLNGADDLLGSYSEHFKLENSQEMYSPIEQIIKLDMETEETLNNTVGEKATGFINVFINAVYNLANMVNVFWWVLGLMKIIAWLVNVVVYPMFLLERSFLLMILQIALPLVLALGAFEKFRPMVWNWFKIYIAVYMTGLFFLFATWFCDQFYITMSERHLASGGAEMGAIFAAKSIVFMVIVFTKVKLFQASISLSNRIFKSE